MTRDCPHCGLTLPDIDHVRHNPEDVATLCIRYGAGQLAFNAINEILRAAGCHAGATQTDPELRKATRGHVRTAMADFMDNLHRQEEEATGPATRTR